MRARALVVVLSAGFVVLVGASRSSKAGEECAAPPEVPRLSAEGQLSAPALRLPTLVVLRRGHIILLDRYAPEKIIAMERRTGAVVATFGRQGQGPRELLGPFDFTLRGDTLRVLDLSLGRITTLLIEQSPRPSDAAQGPAREAHGIELRWLSVAPLSDERMPFAIEAGGRAELLGLVLGDPSLVRIDGGRDATPIRAVPDVRFRAHLPPARLVEAVLGRIRASPDGGRVVRVYRYSSRIEVLDARGNVALRSGGPADFAPDPDKRADRLGYLDVAAHGAGFFALYSGRTRSDCPDAAGYGREIHAFDWKGHLRQRFALDSELIAIVYAPAEGLLFGIRHDPSPQVVTYRIANDL